MPGVVALATYWIAALARKGSGPHRLAGKVYLVAMVALLLPVLSVPLLNDDPPKLLPVLSRCSDFTPTPGRRRRY